MAVKRECKNMLYMYTLKGKQEIEIKELITNLKILIRRI